MKQQLSYLILMIFLSFSLKSQTAPVTLKFSYDTAGNQIFRDDALGTSEEKLEATIEDKFSVSPNPSMGHISLAWELDVSEKITSIKVFNMMASKIVEVKPIKDNSVTIDLTGTTAGLYLLIVYLNNEEVSSIQKKIIKI